MSCWWCGRVHVTMTQTYTAIPHSYASNATRSLKEERFLKALDRAAEERRQRVKASRLIASRLAPKALVAQRPIGRISIAALPRSNC